MGHAVPAHIVVKGVKAYNVEPYNTQAINYVIRNEISDRKRKDKDDSHCTDKNFEYHECNRMYCSFCLKFHYDLTLNDCKNKWLCPFCEGNCHCTRCSRQDQLLKMRALLFAEGGNLDHLFESNNKIHQIIAENWVRAEKVMIRIKDDNFRPPSPIRTIKRIPHLHLACDSTVESVGENGPIVTAQEIKELMNKREELLSLIEELKSKKQEEKEKVTERFNLSKFLILRSSSRDHEN